MDATNFQLMFIFRMLVGVGLYGFVHISVATTLPEERLDIMHHQYSGGGMDIKGPAVLVRKHVNHHLSAGGHYYVDDITGASVDVLTYASPYTEKRTEAGIETDILYQKTKYEFNYAQSDENDYHAKSADIDIRQSLFGDLTILNLGFSRGWDTVGDATDPTFKEDARRQNYRLGINQIISPTMTAHSVIEMITQEGYLQNNYRQVRFESEDNFYQFEPELYPNTRTSYAWAIGGLNYVFDIAAVKYQYRFYKDDWEVTSHTAEVEYRHQHRQWTFHTRLRLYNQDQAEFFSDLFPRREFLSFRTRDKELSSFSSATFGLGASHPIKLDQTDWLENSSVSFAIDHIRFDYDNFRDATITDSNGQRIAATEQPLYQFSANVIRLIFSARY